MSAKRQHPDAAGAAARRSHAGRCATSCSRVCKQCALTAEFSKSAAQEAVKAHIDDALSRVKSLEQVVGPTLEGVNLAEAVSALKQQGALTADIGRSAAHEAVHVHLDQHSAVLSRVETLETVVSALKQQCASTAEICRSAAHEAVHALVQPVLSRVKSLERLVGPPSPERLNLASAVPEPRQQSALIAESAKVLLACRSSHAC